VAETDVCQLLCLDLPKAEAVRASQPGAAALQRAAERGRALSDPTRLMVAAALQQGGELCVCDLAWVTGRSDKLVSHHARALRGAGLAESRRDGKMILYSLTSAGRALVEAVLLSEVKA
jgi:DNA-binding transcriptional ArsR family regulator